MKELLIIFVILLVLLLLISTFGGSIRQKETFYQATPILNAPSINAMEPMPPPPKFEIPKPDKKNDNGFSDLINLEPYINNNSSYAPY